MRADELRIGDVTERGKVTGIHVNLQGRVQVLYEGSGPVWHYSAATPFFDVTRADEISRPGEVSPSSSGRDTACTCELWGWRTCAVCAPEVHAREQRAATYQEAP